MSATVLIGVEKTKVHGGRERFERQRRPVSGWLGFCASLSARLAALGCPRNLRKVRWKDDATQLNSPTELWRRTVKIINIEKSVMAKTNVLWRQKNSSNQSVFWKRSNVFDKAKVCSDQTCDWNCFMWLWNILFKEVDENLFKFFWCEIKFFDLEIWSGLRVVYLKF